MIILRFEKLNKVYVILQICVESTLYYFWLIIMGANITVSSEIALFSKLSYYYLFLIAMMIFPMGLVSILWDDSINWSSAFILINSKISQLFFGEYSNIQIKTVSLLTNWLNLLFWIIFMATNRSRKFKVKSITDWNVAYFGSLFLFNK